MKSRNGTIMKCQLSAELVHKVVLCSGWFRKKKSFWDKKHSTSCINRIISTIIMKYVFLTEIWQAIALNTFEKYQCRKKHIVMKLLSKWREKSMKSTFGSRIVQQILQHCWATGYILCLNDMGNNSILYNPIRKFRIKNHFYIEFERKRWAL